MNPHEYRFQSSRQSFQRVPLLIGATSYTPWESLAPVLKHLGWEDQDVPADVGGWLEERFLRENSGTRFLLLHTSLERTVAIAMRRGELPEKAFKQWYRSARGLLAFYRLNPENSVVLGAEAAVSNPDELMHWLGENRPEFLPENPEGANFRIELPNLDEEDPLISVIACQTVAQHPEAQHVLNELDAASAPFSGASGDAPLVDLNNLFETITAGAKASRTKIGQLTAGKSRFEQELKQENEALSKQINDIRREFEEAQSEAQSLRRANAQLGETQALKVSLKQELAQVRDENERLLEQLHKTQEELEQTFYQLKVERKRSADYSGQNAKLQENQQTLDDVRRESELLLIQLHNVQEELERYYLNNQALTEKQSAQRRRIKKLDESTASLSKENRKLKEELERYCLNNQALAKEHSAQKRRIKKLDSSATSLSKENKKLRKERRQLTYDVHQANIQLSKRSVKGRLQSLIQLPAKAVRRLLPKSRRIRVELKLVRESGLFDDQWYLENNPDIQGLAIDPLVHFVLYGGQEGRSPSLKFSSRWYLDKYKDVAEVGLNPLIHYLTSGKAEGRQISPGSAYAGEK